MNRLPKKLRDPEYLQALGGFVERFAITEGALFFALRFYTRMPMPMVRALHSGVRVQEAISFIRRVNVAIKPKKEIAPNLDAALVQLKLITDRRNDILHFGTTITDGGERIVSNEIRALTREALRAYRVSAQNLVDMTLDLEQICLLILSYAVLRIAKNPEKDEIKKQAEAWRGPWRYMPEPPPKNPARPKRGHQQSRPRQRRPSRG